LDKIESEKDLSDKEQQLLREAYGANWKNKLGLTLKNPIIFQSTLLFDDDNINTVRTKIANACNVKTSTDIYLWSFQFVHNNRIFWKQALSNLFVDKKLTSGIALKHFLYCLFNKKHEEISNEAIFTLDEALSLVLHIHKDLHVIKKLVSVGFMNLHNNAQYIYHPNPAHANGNIPDRLIVLDQGRKSLESYCIAERTIYITSKNEIDQAWHSVYFPLTNNPSVTLPPLSHHTNFDKIYKEIRSDFSTSCYLGYAQVRNIFGLPLDLNAVSIEQIFQKIRIKADGIVFCKKHTRNGSILMKISKSILANNFRSDLLQWTKQVVFKRSALCDSLILKMKHEHLYVTIVILSNGTCDVKVRFNVHRVINYIDFLTNVLKKVNLVLKGLRQESDIQILDFDTNIFHGVAYETPTRIINLSIAAILKSNLVIPSLKNFEHVLTSNPYFESRFAVLKAEDGFIDIIYRNTNDFGNNTQLQSFIAKNSNLKAHELLEKVVNIFNIPKDEALSMIKDWRKLYTQNAQKLGIFKSQIASNTTIFLKSRIKTTNNSVQLITDGITSIQYYKRIMRLLKVIWHDATKLSGTRKTTKSKQVDKAITNDVNQDDADQFKNAFMDVDNDMLDDVNDIFGDMEKDVQAMMINDNAQDEPDEKVTHGKERVLADLKKADKILFTEKSVQFQSYARTCQYQSMRQPIVINKNELDALKKDSITNHYNYRNNVYICPDVWCPKSRQSFTRADFEKRKMKCPDPSETALIFYDPESKTIKARYTSFLPAHKHPLGLCMPCCYTKKKPNLTGADCGAEEEEDITGNIRYVKSDAGPATPGRYSILPKQFSDFMGNKFMSNRPNGTGIMQANCSAYFRFGLQAKQQSFLYCMSQILGVPAFQDENDILKALCDNIDLVLFMKLQNGNLVKKFLSRIDNKIIYDTTAFTKFKGWFLSKTPYIEQFDLYKLKQVISTSLVFKDSLPYALDIRREFVLWAALNTFIEDFLKNDNIIKTHHLLLDLFNLHIPWLNSKGLNIILVEYDFVNNTVLIPCFQSSSFRTQKDFVVVIKTGQFYEPLHHVSIASKGDLNVNSRFDKTHFDSINKLYKIVTNSKACASLRDANDIFIAFKSIGETIGYMVLDFDFNVVACIIRVTNGKGILIPLPYAVSLTYVTKHNCCFIDDALQYHVATTKKQVVETLITSLNSIWTERLVLEKQTYSINNFDFLVLSNNIVLKYIPLQALSADDLHNVPTVLNDLYMMLQLEHPDPRTSLIKELFIVDKLTIALWNEVIKFLNRSTAEKKQLAFLRDPMNIIPKVHKASMLYTLIADFLPKIAQIAKTKMPDTAIHKNTQFHNKLCSAIGRKQLCHSQCSWIATFINNELKGGKCKLLIPQSILSLITSKIVLDLLNINIPLRQRAINDDYKDTDTIIIGENDVKKGSLDTLLNNIEKENELGFKIKEHSQENTIANVQKNNSHSDETMQLGDETRTLPTQLRPLLKGYSVVVADNYDQNYLYNAFSKIYNIVHAYSGDQRMNQVQLKELVVSRIKSDLNNNSIASKVIDDLLYNPSLNKFFKKEKVSGADILAKITDDSYFPSDYELKIIAELCNINIFVWGRKTLRNPDNTWCLGKSSIYTVCLEQTSDKQRKIDVYEFFINTKTQKIVFETDNMPSMIQNKCKLVLHK
jgi:hypothetical protein